MVVLGGGAVSYQRGTPVQPTGARSLSRALPTATDRGVGALGEKLARERALRSVALYLLRPTGVKAGDPSREAETQGHWTSTWLQTGGWVRSVGRSR